mmetsp:Transcript_61363/g.113926  ORF Transcript_61363/g.113926 Transcript_61363/m.113926 type:complete len:388 (+) Transcript_61363:61-1224(+)
MQVLPAIAVLFLSGSLCGVHGHGYLAFPPLRGGIGGNDDNGYCPHCGNGAGTCGDGGQWPANSDFLNYESTTLTSLQAGSIHEFTVYITAHHMGHFEFAICDQLVSGDLLDPQGCFDSRKLHRADPPADCVPNDARGDCQPIQPEYPERWYLPPSAGTHTMRFQIPADLSCSACTLQWRWWTANSCVPAPNYGCFFDLLEAEGWDSSEWCGAFCGDCRPGYEPGHYSCGEEFRNCADITISGGGDQVPTTTTADTGSTNSPTTPTASATTLATPPPSGMCVWNRDCDVNAWCNDPVYENWCPLQGQSCPSPQCVPSGTTLPPSSASSTVSEATTLSGSSTTLGQTPACMPIGDCGTLGFCDQALFESYCEQAGTGGGACPAPFCQRQ